MAKIQPIEHSKRAQKREQRARGEDMSTISTKNGRRFLDKTPFVNFIKPEKSGKSCHYEKTGKHKRWADQKADRRRGKQKKTLAKKII